MAPPAAVGAAMEVRCAGCGETLEVDHGTTEFACPGCATEQRLPPELMPPPPPRPRRVIPLTPVAAAHDRVPCGGCGAVLSVPPGLRSFGCPICCAAGRRPQASALPAAQPVPLEAEVLEDTLALSQATHAGQVHAEMHKIPTQSEQSQGWRPNHSVLRDESFRFSSFRAEKRVPIHGAHEKSYNPSALVEDSHIEPLHQTTTRPSKKNSRIQSSRVVNVQKDCSSQAIPVLQAQRVLSDYSVHTNQSQGRFPGDIIARHGKHKTTVAPKTIGKELIEPPNQATHEQQAWRTSSDGAHAHQAQVEPGSGTAPWNQKRKRSRQSAGGNRKRNGLMNSSKEGLQLRPIQLLNSSPHENQSDHQDIARIVANVTPSSPPQQQVPQASYNALDDVDASTLPSSFNHCILQAECINNRYSPGSYSWCDDEMTHGGSYGADAQPIPLETPNQVTNGQQARLSSGENNLEQVGVEHYRKNIAVRGRHKTNGSMSSSNEAEQPGASSVSGTRQQMTLVASCRRLAASMPVLTTNLAPTGALHSVLEGGNPSMLPCEPSPVAPSQLQDDEYPFEHPDGHFYPYPRQSSGGGEMTQRAVYERRKKARTDRRDDVEVYLPENDPALEEWRREVEKARREKRPARRGVNPNQRPPRTDRASSEDTQVERTQRNPQTANVARGGHLLPRRERVQGSGSSAPSEVQAQENVEVQDEIGPLRLTKPTRSNEHVRHVINYKGKSAVVKTERKDDPHKYERFSSDDRFWNFFQQDFYETVIFTKKSPVSQMQWVDWNYMQEQDDPVFNEVIAVCEHHNLKRIMALEYPWCNEVIAQFYATLYVGKDTAKTMLWMTNGKWYKVKYEAFARTLGFTQGDSHNKERIHDEFVRTSNTMEYMYNKNEEFTFGSTKGLLPFYAYLNRMFRKTMAPKDGDASHISSYTLNLLHRMKEDTRTFDVFDFIWKEIRLISIDPKRGCGYAPYIMCMIESITNLKFHKEQCHTGLQVRLIKPPRSVRKKATPRDESVETPSSSSSTWKALKVIFNMCKTTSVRVQKERKARTKLTLRVKQIHRHLNIDPPCSPNGSEVEPSDEDIIKDPFQAAQESTSEEEDEEASGSEDE